MFCGIRFAPSVGGTLGIGGFAVVCGVWREASYPFTVSSCVCFRLVEDDD